MAEEQIVEEQIEAADVPSKTMMDRIADAKMVLGTGTLVVAALVGAWNMASDVFITKAYAESVYMKHINRNDSQTSYNKLFILGQRIDSLVKKNTSGGLTPEEERQLIDLRRDYLKVSEHIKRIENKDYSDE